MGEKDTREGEAAPEHRGAVYEVLVWGGRRRSRFKALVDISIDSSGEQVRCFPALLRCD